MNPDVVIELIKQYGFPIVAAVGMGYFVYFIYSFVTKELTPLIGQTSGILIALIDRIRMLDNDLIRLNQKVDVVLHLRGKTIEHERVMAEDEINKKLKEKEPEKIVTASAKGIDQDDAKTANAGEG